MTITIESTDIQEVEKLLAIFKTLNIRTVRVKGLVPNKKPVIVRGDKKINPADLFGIWKDNPRTMQQIRSTAWQRNWNL